MSILQKSETHYIPKPYKYFGVSAPSLLAFVFVFKIQSQQAGCTMTKWQQMLVLQRARRFPLIIQEHSWSGHFPFDSRFTSSCTNGRATESGSSAQHTLQTHFIPESTSTTKAPTYVKDACRERSVLVTKADAETVLNAENSSTFYGIIISASIHRVDYHWHFNLFLGKNTGDVRDNNWYFANEKHAQWILHTSLRTNLSQYIFPCLKITNTTSETFL